MTLTIQNIMELSPFFFFFFLQIMLLRFVNIYCILNKIRDLFVRFQASPKIGGIKILLRSYYLSLFQMQISPADMTFLSNSAFDFFFSASIKLNIIQLLFVLIFFVIMNYSEKIGILYYSTSLHKTLWLTITMNLIMMCCSCR